MSSSHDFSSVANFDQATPMLLLAMACLILISIRVLFYDTLLSWGFTISTSVIEVDENLPNFFHAVKLCDADWLVKESSYFRQKYQFNFVDERTVEILDDTPICMKPITGIVWYQVLANPNYVRDFNYITASVEDRADYIVDGDSDEENDCEQSDMVSILINLGFLKQEVARTFQFGQGYSNTLGKEIIEAKRTLFWHNQHVSYEEIPK